MDPGANAVAAVSPPGRCSLVCLAIVMLAAAKVRAAEAGSENTLPTDAPPFRISAWNLSSAVRANGGYKDNVLLSSFHPSGSAFAGAGLDLFVMRLPWDGSEVNLLLTADDRHYFSVAEANEEATVLASAQFRKTFAAGWAVGLSGEYFFMNQVFDASATEADLGIVLARGHSVGVRPVISRSLGRSTWLDLELGVTRQWLDEPLDNYWETGPKFRLRHEYGPGSELYLSYELYRRPYDTREQTAADGTDLPGTKLSFDWQRVETGWRQHWDQRRRWRTTTRLGFDVNADNGSGYYDYHKYFVAEQLRWRCGHWDLRLQGGLNYYRYALQQVSPEDPSARKKPLVTAGARVTRELSGKLKAVAEYEYEQSMSNQTYDAYRFNTVVFGFEWEF